MKRINGGCMGLDKNQVEVMEKLKHMMLNFKTDIQKRHSLSTVNPKFVITNENGYDVISVNLTKVSANSKILTDDECFDILENYLFQDSSSRTPLRVFLIGQRSFNHITQAIIKNPSEEVLQDKLINVFFNTKDEDVYENFIVKINKAIKEKGFDSALGKSLIFKVLGQIGKTGSLPGFEMSYFSKRFPDIISKVAKFDINEADYPTLHSVFKYYETAIKDSHLAQCALEGFLKKKIPTKNWGEFKVYFKKEYPYYDKAPKMSGMFEEKTNPKLHLNLNEVWIKENYPILSISNDYRNMVMNIIKIMNTLRDSFGLESCQTINTNTNITTLYCISKDENPIDAEKIKSVLESVIDLYAEAKERQQEFSEKDFLTTFKASILSYELENSNPPQEVKPKRTNKI
jgi:hypothetical protein